MGTKTQRNRLLMVLAVTLIAGVWSLSALVDTAWAKPGGGKPGDGGSTGPTHTVVFLGEEDTSAVNNAGVVVGRTYDGAGYVINPVDTDGDGIGDLWYDDANGDGLNDFSVILHEAGLALDIADTGEVVGHNVDPTGTEVSAYSVSPIDTDGDGNPDTWYQDSDGDGVNDLMTLLPELYPGMWSARGVNNHGQIVGVALLPSGEEPMAVLWNGGLPIELGTLGGGDSWASAINDVGEIVGRADDAAGQQRAFFLRPADSDGDGIGDTWFVDAGDGITNALMIDLGTLGGNTAEAVNLNDSSQIVGNADDDSESLPVMWEVDAVGNVTTTPIIGKKNTRDYAGGINASGVIVGQSRTEAQHGPLRMPDVDGFVYENGTLTALSDRLDIPISSSVLNDLNDSMVMVGRVYSDYGDGAAIMVPLP